MSEIVQVESSKEQIIEEPLNQHSEKIEDNDIDISSKYVVLCETSEEYCESWYYFIKYKGNEDALQYLQEQLEEVDMILEDDLSTFELDLEHLFSYTTAKEMTKLEIQELFHRKFDGELQMINLKLRDTDTNIRKLEKCFKKLGEHGIENYIDQEDENSDLSTASEYSSEEDSDITEDSRESEIDDELIQKIEDNTISSEDFKEQEKQKKNNRLYPVKVEKVAGGRRKKNRKKKQ